MEFAIVVAVIAVAVIFDYTNGFHDAANAIATSISTRALTPHLALLMAAAMNFVGAWLGQKVAQTVSDTIDPGDGSHGLVIVLAGLIGAIAWNLATWYVGLPSSSSHALIGGLVGAALAAGAVVNWTTVLHKVVVPMFVVPAVAFTLAFGSMVLILWGFRHHTPGSVGKGFRLAQTVSAAAMALGHGLQDAQKTMGVIFLALVTGGYASASDPLPLWVILLAATAIALGTYSGGWPIIRTLADRIVDLDAPRGFAAESVSAGILYTAAHVFEAPVSSTHTITGAVMGVGATKRLSAVRWQVVNSIGSAWLLTFPAAGVIAAASYAALRLVISAP